MLFRRRGLPDGWLDIVQDSVAIWGVFDTEERAMLEATADWLLSHKHWEAAQGFALTDEITVTIAALASVPLLRLEVEEYREVGAIVLFPSVIEKRQVIHGPAQGTLTERDVTLAGEANPQRGPVLIAWDQAREEARTPGTGRNVVYHEFAHKLDMFDHTLDGTPSLSTRDQRRRWFEVCTEVYLDLRRGAARPPLQPYGATNPGEFFAVATEAFLDAPLELEENEPNLYQVLRDFFRQDPADRLRRRGTWAAR